MFPEHVSCLFLHALHTLCRLSGSSRICAWQRTDSDPLPSDTGINRSPILGVLLPIGRTDLIGKTGHTFHYTFTLPWRAVASHNFSNLCTSLNTYVRRMVAWAAQDADRSSGW